MFRKTAFAVAMAASVFAATAVQAHPKLSSATPAADTVVVHESVRCFIGPFVCGKVDLQE